jgi:hypothetical protein
VCPQFVFRVTCLGVSLAAARATRPWTFEPGHPSHLRNRRVPAFGMRRTSLIDALVRFLLSIAAAFQSERGPLERLVYVCENLGNGSWCFQGLGVRIHEAARSFPTQRACAPDHARNPLTRKVGLVLCVTPPPGRPMSRA